MISFYGVFPYFKVNLILLGCIETSSRMRSPLQSEQYTTFLEEFRELRARAELSQVELAMKLGIGQDIVSRCEAGRRRVDVMELQQWAEACGSSLMTFVQRLDDRAQRNQNPQLLRPEASPKKR